MKIKEKIGMVKEYLELKKEVKRLRAELTKANEDIMALKEIFDNTDVPKPMIDKELEELLDTAKNKNNKKKTLYVSEVCNKIEDKKAKQYITNMKYTTNRIDKENIKFKTYGGK